MTRFPSCCKCQKQMQADSQYPDRDSSLLVVASAFPLFSYVLLHDDYLFLSKQRMTRPVCLPP